jgi:hypothetical protein
MHVREDLEEVAQMEGSLDGTKTMRFETAGMQAGDYQIRMDMKVLNLCILPRESGHGMSTTKEQLVSYQILKDKITRIFNIQILGDICNSIRLEIDI